jgi:hypothetical protein
MVGVLRPGHWVGLSASGRAIATTSAVSTAPSGAGRYLNNLLRRLEAALSGSVVDTAAFEVRD